MQKRVVHLILAIIFLTTTIVQSFGSALAVAVNKETVTANTTSKIVNPRSTIEGANSVSESLASSLQSQSTSSASTSSDSKSSSKSSDAKSSSNSTSEKESTKAPTTSKSVLIQPRADFKPTDSGYEYPDFSKPLWGQPKVTTIEYDGNNYAVDKTTKNPVEINAPNNAFPVYIDGVSTETDYGEAKNKLLHNPTVATATKPSRPLSGDKDYIKYTKVMSFNDTKGDKKVHWVDVTERFVGFETHGWYNDWAQFKQFASSKFPLNLNRDIDSDFNLDTRHYFTTGRGTNTTGNVSKMFGLDTTFDQTAFFGPRNLKNSDGGANQTNPIALNQFRQAVKIKLEFTDSESGKPINISGFLTIADLDHRDFIQFGKSSNIDNVYVTHNEKTNSYLKGTINPNAEYPVTIVNSNGNKDYINNQSEAVSYEGWDGGNFPNDIITPDNTDAWVTVTFTDTNSLEYNVSDPERMDFIGTSLVPVEFSWPAKTGDGDDYSSDWDDKSIDYKVSATLPYRGNTIKNPAGDLINSQLPPITTFHRVKSFKLVDPVDKNLTINKSNVVIKDQIGNDVSSNFTITIDGNNQIIAEANDAFLADEANYAKTYLMDIPTTLKADANLDDYARVTHDGKTYAVIANQASIKDIKDEQAGTQEKTWESNVANGHVPAPKLPDPVREVQDMKQEIKNYDTAGEDWQPVVDDMSTTQGHVGDKVGYRFSFKAKDSNTASITDASINAISVNPGLSAPTNAKVTVGSTTTDGTIVEGSTPGVYSIKIDTPIKKGETVTVTFERTANKKGVYMQNGFLKAASLTAAPAGHNLVPDGYMFNFAVINVAEANNTATIQQFIKNRNTANETWKGPGIGDDKAETSGVPGNIIDYKFKITPGAKNTADLLATALKDIAMKESGGMTLVNPEGSVDNTKQVKITVDGSQPIYIGGNPISNNAELNDVFTPLTKGKGMTIEYSAKISKTAYTQDVTNDANFYASNLTGNMPAASTVADKAHKTPANQSILHIKNQREVEDLKQKIKNKTAKEDWHYDATKDPKAETDGHVGDVIAYEFSFTALTDNTADIEGQIVKAIGIQKNDQLTAPANMAVTVGDNNTPITATLEGTTENDYSVKLADGKGITAGQTVKVYLERTVKPAAAVGDTYIQSGQTGDGLSAGAGTAFNDAVLHIVMPLQTTTITQTIQNLTDPSATDSSYIKSTGKAGDIIQYTFKVPKGSANSLLVNAALQDIRMQMNNETDDMTLVPYEDSNIAGLVPTPGHEIAVIYSDAGGKPVFANTADFKIGNMTLPPYTGGGNATQIVIKYQMKIGTTTTDGETITNDANLYADNLQGNMPAGSTVTNKEHKIPANQTVLKIKHKQAVTIDQSIKNKTNPETDTTTRAIEDSDFKDTDYKTETKGSKDDVIDYRFKIKAASDNTGNITGLKIMNIVMDKADQLAHIANPASNTDYTVQTKVLKGDGSYVDGGIATFNSAHTELTLANTGLKPGETLIVVYQMKITADVDDTTIATDKIVNNDADLTADILTNAVTTNGKTTNQVIPADTAKNGAKKSFNTTVLNLEAGKSIMTIQYVDLDKLKENWAMPILAKVAEPIQVEGKIGKELSTVRPGERLAPKVIPTESGTPNDISLDGYTVVSVTSQKSDAADLENSNWSPAYKDDPKFSNDDTTITYGYKKRMISIQAPDEWDFGSYNRTMEDKTYYLKAKDEPQKVTVSDYYGVTNWTLNVKQETPFKDTNNHELTGAELIFKNGSFVTEANTSTSDPTAQGQMKDIISDFKLTPSNTNGQDLMTFNRTGRYQKDDATADNSSKSDPYTDAGYSIWSYKLGDKKTADISIGLHVPDTTPREEGHYTSTLDWSLTVAP